MNKYTISDDFLSCALNNKKFLFNVLLAFFQDNEYILCLDKKGTALDFYFKVDNDLIKTVLEWIEQCDKIYIVNDEIIEQNDSVLFFVELASCVCPNKNLIVSDKKTYYAKCGDKIEEKRVNILDGEQAKTQMSQKNINVYNITNGDNSPIITGNNNFYKI